MSRRPAPSHRLDQRPARRASGGRRAATSARPRLGRITFAATAFAITLVAVLGGIGVIPIQHRPPAAAQEHASGGLADLSTTTQKGSSAARTSTRPASQDSKTLPAAAGSGRRIVFAISRQRVWLVDRSGKVERTYLVSGSLTHNLHPGTYSVFSKSRWAVGIDDSGVMQYFVRFAHGVNAAIGFHSIPTLNGRPLQTKAQLGTPQSHGCIRQDLPDAIKLWDFAPVGTRVVVTA
ncbi:MAG TPA: L,D-transpeptidase [Marmoricola sp.]